MNKLEKFVRSKLPKNFIDNHVKEVVKESLWLCKFYPKADKEIVKTGAWLHDLVHSMGGYRGKDQNLASAKSASEYLNSIGYDKVKIPKIVHCVESHSTGELPEPKTIEAKKFSRQITSLILRGLIFC